MLAFSGTLDMAGVAIDADMGLLSPSRLSLAGLELDLVLPEHVSARQKLFGRIFVRNHKSWLPSFSIHLAGSPPSAVSSSVYFPVIPGGTTLEETVEVAFGRRGLYRENSFRFSSRFPFGFDVAPQRDGYNDGSRFAALIGDVLDLGFRHRLQCTPFQWREARCRYSSTASSAHPGSVAGRLFRNTMRRVLGNGRLVESARL